MAKRNSLADSEVAIVKRLLEDGNYTNQEIAGLINRSRGDASSDVSTGRITNIKKNEIQKYDPIKPASDEELAFFMARLNAFDPQTGLNLYDDERLVRAREAMILAVQSFNSPALKFKTEQFAVQSNIAWTYLLHEYFDRNGVEIIGKDGRSLLLSQMIKRHDCPLSKGVTNNLEAIMEIRHDVEHKLLGRSDQKFFPLFQANCLNFDNAIRMLFGEKLTLQNDLSIALQFSKLDFTQAVTLQNFDIPEHIASLDVRLAKKLTDEEKQDLEYQFRVIYTLDHASKSKAHFEFVKPGSAAGREIHNILEKRVIADDDYPYKPGQAHKLIAERSGRKFTSHNHTQAWKRYKVRPKSNAKQKDQTNREYCIYHKSHNDYTYNDAWVDFMVAKISEDAEYTDLIRTKV